MRTALDYELLSKEELGRLEVVGFNLEDPETIPAALGGAGRVRGLFCA